MGDTPPKGTARPTQRPSTPLRPSSTASAARASSVELMMAGDDHLANLAATPRASRIITPLPVAAQRFMVELEAGSPVGDYRIQEQIGEGAMGTVYAAIHSIVGKTVAIKVLKPELCANQASIDRFVQEAQAVNRIGHPNIVDVFSLDVLPDGRAYMVMEWLHGEDLKTRLARGPMSVTDACDILDGIARALDAAHAKDIVHRDLKPDNVFLHRVDDGPVMVKLLDFGIAKLLRAQGVEKTQTGNMLGTPRYISPEQARGVDVTHKSDIYSLGVLAYEMLAGRAPFQGETGMDLVVKHLSETPPPLSQFTRVPKPLEHCVMRMLSKDPLQRPALAEIRQTLSDPTRKVLRAQLPSPKRLVLVVGAVLLVAAAGFASWKLLANQEQERQVAAAAPAIETPAIETPAIEAPPPAPAVAPPPVAQEEAVSLVDEPWLPKSSVEVNVTGPKGSVIYIDGKRIGAGPKIKAEVEAGEHDIEVRAPGRRPHVQHVSIEPGQDALVAIVVPMTRPIARPTKRPKKPPKVTPPGDDDLLAPKDVLNKGKK